MMQQPAIIEAKKDDNVRRLDFGCQWRAAPPPPESSQKAKHKTHSEKHRNYSEKLAKHKNYSEIPHLRSRPEGSLN